MLGKNIGELAWSHSTSLVGCYENLFLHNQRTSRLTTKAEPRGNGDVANANAQAQNGCAQPRWLRRLVRHHRVHI
jgi:hypothetical protein